MILEDAMNIAGVDQVDLASSSNVLGRRVKDRFCEEENSRYFVWSHDGPIKAVTALELIFILISFNALKSP